MPGKKIHSGVVRGEVTHEENGAIVQLGSEEALNLIRHVAEALACSDERVIEPHWGCRGGQTNLHRIDVRSA